MNEATIVELATRIGTALGDHGLSHELILVIDSSPDRSRAVAAEVAATDHAVGAVDLEENVGQHRAVLVGLGEARGRWTVVMDGDLQDPPEAIPALVETARNGFDAVFAVRRGRHQNWHRRVTSRVFKLIMRMVAHTPIDAGSYMVLSRSLVDELCCLRPANPSLMVMVGLTARAVSTVPVRRVARVHGRSAYSGRARLRAAGRALWFAVRWRWHRRCPQEQGSAPAIAARHGLCATRG
jgi:glycosyltransferase involved in cell wall biosynthesis